MCNKIYTYILQNKRGLEIRITTNIIYAMTL